MPNEYTRHHSVSLMQIGVVIVLLQASLFGGYLLVRDHHYHGVAVPLVELRGESECVRNNLQSVFEAGADKSDPFITYAALDAARAECPSQIAEKQRKLLAAQP